MLTELFNIKASEAVKSLFQRKPDAKTILYIFPNIFNSGLTLEQAQRDIRRNLPEDVKEFSQLTKDGYIAVLVNFVQATKLAELKSVAQILDKIPEQAFRDRKPQ